MFFQYTALNPERKKLSGTIEAENEQDARARINELGLSILSLTALEAPPPGVTARTGMQRFSFESLDRNGKRVIGTIDALTFDEAFEKLAGEYLLNVEKLFRENASAGDKEKTALKLQALKTDLELKQQKLQKDSGNAIPEEDKAKQELLKKVDQTIKTIEAFLDEYGQDMKSDERDNIRGSINQLYRIKDSTNLKHIQQTCEKMLSYLEKKEIFLEETRHLKEEAQIKVESHELLESFKQTGLHRDIDFTKILKIISQLTLIQGLIRRITEYFLLEDDQAITLRQKTKVLRGKIWEFRKIAFRSKDINYKNEIKETIRQLSEEKNRYDFELQALKAKRHEEQAEKGIALRRQFFGGGSLLIGWLLAFYLIFYFLSYPFIFKELPLTFSPPQTFAFYQIPFLKAILILLFLLHITITLHQEIFPRKTFSSLLLYPAFGILYLFFLFNFVI